MLVNRICRTVLVEAHAVGDPLVSELAARVEAELRFEHAAETGDDTELDAGRSGPLDDRGLLALVVAAGPHSAAVEALMRAFAAIVAEHDAYDRGEVA